jgi:hypothetical protein
MNVWESIFIQSPVNRGYYDEDNLPHVRWQWAPRHVVSDAPGIPAPPPRNAGR